MHAREYIPVKAFLGAPLSTGGSMGMGSDVGVYQLSAALYGHAVTRSAHSAGS